MTTADNDARAAQLVRALEVSVLGDASRLEELFTTDVTGLSPILSCSSLAEFAVELEEQENVFTEVAIEVHPLDVGGDRACVEWVASAVHSGPLPLDEDEMVVIEGSGRRVSFRGVSVAEFDDDKISAFRHYWDDVALFDELGLLPED